MRIEILRGGYGSLNIIISTLRGVFCIFYILFYIYLNSTHLNSGDLNSGDLNSGDLNSGDLNSGDLNSGDLNSTPHFW